MKKDHFSSQNKALNGIEQLSVKLGANPNTSNPMNALRSVTKAINDLVTLEEQAQGLGYKSAALALKALSQMKQPVSDYTYLPEVFHTVPWVWLNGKHPTKNDPGFPPMSLTQAQRKHRTVMPLILEMWQLFEDDEISCDQLVKDYLHLSADKFEKMMYKWIYDLVEVTIEQEFTNRLEATPEELEACLKLATDKNRIYGVTKDKLDLPEWD